ncbi:MAG TPA: hypothetical protein VKX31_01635 [Brumimicrobium sp.]|nr:hypothetical protein [Brumimicrobium sp.]
MVKLCLIRTKSKDENKSKKELREKARLEFEKSLPISREIFQELFDFIDERLSENGCDDTLKITK